MRTALVKILTCVPVYVLTVGVLLNWVGDVSTAQALPPPQVNSMPPQANAISLPAGTRILVRLSEPLSSVNQRVGGRFTGRLETNLMSVGEVAAPRGTTVHGKVTSAESAGRMAGGSELALELTDIVINDTAHPIMTNTYQLQGQGRGGATTRSVGIGAGLGSVVGALAGGGRGAAIGAAAGGGLGTASAAGGRGQEVNFTQGSLLEFRLQQPALLPHP
jgi:hypothetical protein